MAQIRRTLVLEQRKKKNDFEIHFACSTEGLRKINASALPFKTYPINTISSTLFYERVNNANFFYTPKELNNYVIDEKELIKKIDPDLVVSDFRLTASISCASTNKPLLNLSNSYWCPNTPCLFPAPAFGIFKILPQKPSDLLFHLVRPVIFKTFGKELNQLRIKNGLEKKADFRELYTDGTYTAYMDMPDFIKTNKLPNNHFFLGPIILNPEASNQEMELTDNNYVYISMGSSGDSSLLPTILSSALKFNLKIILSGIEEKEKIELIKKIPQLKNKCIMKPLIHAENILKNCKLTICHGGSGTLYQSLAQGVPVLCFPKNPDQGLASMAIADNNLGRYISSKLANQNNIEVAIFDCLSNEVLKENALQYAKKIKLWNTETHWIQFLNKFKTTRKLNRIIA